MNAWKTARGALSCPPGAQCKATALEWFAGQDLRFDSKTLESRHLWKVNIQLARDFLCGENRLFPTGHPVWTDGVPAAPPESWGFSSARDTYTRETTCRFGGITP